MPADEFNYYLYVSPFITSVSTLRISRINPAEMTITGGNLSNATAVAFGSLQATIVSETDNQIVVDVPPAPAATGLVDVTVTTSWAGTTETDS